MSVGETLGLDNQLIGLRHDQHDRLAGRHHAADGMSLELVHDPVLRRADIDALEQIFGCDLALAKLRQFTAALGNHLGDLAAHVALDLDDL